MQMWNFLACKHTISVCLQQPKGKRAGYTSERKDRYPGQVDHGDERLSQTQLLASNVITNLAVEQKVVFC